jgi:putative oxidoreductase
VKKYLSGYAGVIYGLMRIVVGFLFLCHGLQKVFGALGAEQPAQLASLIGVGGLIELIGGGLIMIGLFTSPAAFVCSGMMAVAYFMAHAGKGLLPIQNHGELAVVYCFVFLYIAARGAGRLSVAAALNKPGLE